MTTETAERLRRGIEAHRRNDLVAAEAAYREVLAADPASADALHLLGLVAHATGHLDEAAQLIGQAIALNPGMAAFHSNLANVFLSLKQPTNAIPCLERALEIDPGFAVGHNNLGLAFSAQARFGEATACFRRATELDPGMAAAWGNLANALKDQGMMVDALEAAAAAAAAAPTDPDHRARHGRILHELGRNDEARAVIEAGLAAFPTSSALLMAQGMILLDAGRPVRAMHLFQAAASGSDVPVEVEQYLRRARTRQPDEALHFDRLRAAHADGRLRLRIDTERLRDVHAPLRVEFYDTRAFAVVFVLSGLMIWKLPFVYAASGTALLLFGHLLAGKHWIRHLMHSYAADKITADANLWDRVWNFGAITLQDRDTGDEAVSPKGNWRLFMEDMSLRSQGG